MRAWIGLGGNRPESAALLVQALALLDAAAGVRVTRRSRPYRSPPWGIEDQPDFVNAVAELETRLAAGELLDLLLDIEGRLGRVRDGERWGPRPIDLDLLTYEDVVFANGRLELPHPRMHLRAFVLVPLLEVEPGFSIPGRGAASEQLQQLPPDEVSAVLPLPSELRVAP